MSKVSTKCEVHELDRRFRCIHCDKTARQMAVDGDWRFEYVEPTTKDRSSGMRYDSDSVRELDDSLRVRWELECQQQLEERRREELEEEQARNLLALNVTLIPADCLKDHQIAIPRRLYDVVKRCLG